MQGDRLIELLGLAPHPEGGFFRETHRSQWLVPRMGSAEGPQRAASTAILYLLRPGEFSALHRLKSEEMWHFHCGGPLQVVTLDVEIGRHDILLGPDLANGQRLQGLVSAGRWFGAQLVEGAEYALVGCTVAPGFDTDDYELAERSAMLRQFPDHRDVILALTR